VRSRRGMNLHRLVVVRDDGEDAIRSDLLALLGQLDRFRSAVSSGASHNLVVQ
jgi:hypothetical protein